MSSADFRSNPDNFCYRHPDRQSFVLCQRCLRTICPECQTPLPVGVICPECLQAHAASAPPRAKPTRMPPRLRAVMAADARPLVTYAIVAATTFVWLLSLIPGLGPLVQRSLLLYAPYLYPELSGAFEPWRLLTVLLVHGSFWHAGLNMLALWMLGRSLEPLLGRARFLWLYLLSGLGGSVAVVLFGFTTPVIGASGAIFGMFGALLVIGRHIGANITGIAVVLGINLVLTFLPLIGSLVGASSSLEISWQAHVGGLAVGALVGLIYARTRAVRQRRTQTLLLAATTAGLVLLLVVPALVYR
ncbi:rhomboid family intramembrane serine protease [Microbacterium sp.]|uniref:rhomboid family intramembrane serine protease n=1 Tax=Microbacterium sp. TaxID=51671 RepID=UPI0039E4F453